MDDLERQYEESLELALEGSKFIDEMDRILVRFMNGLVLPLDRVHMSASQSERFQTIKGSGDDKWELTVEWLPNHLTTTGTRPDPGEYRLAVVFHPVGRGFGRLYDLAQVKVPLAYRYLVRRNLNRVLLEMEKMVPAKDYGILSQALDNLKEFGRMARAQKDPTQS